MNPALIRHVLALMLIGACISCESQDRIKHPVYDLENPQKILLPPSLDEISGLAFDPRDSGLFAVGDEIGTVYKIYPSKPSEIPSWELASAGDYEDLALTGDTLWLLRSDGKIKAFRLPLNSGMEEIVRAKLDERGDEFEIILPDPSRSNLMLLCKNCPSDHKGHFGSRIFHLADQSFSTGSFVLLTDSGASVSGDKHLRPHPTAAVRDFSRGLIMILCTRPSCLFEVTEQGRVLNRYLLNPALYKQPEGIALAPDGTLYISNEAAGEGSAELLILPSRKKRSKQ